MRLCQLCQFVSGALPQEKRVVSVVSVPPPVVFKPPDGWRGFHGMLAIWKKYAGGPAATTDTTPRESMKIDEPAAEVRLGPRAQIILDVLRWTAEGMARKQISPGIFEYHVQPKQIGIALRELLERTGGRRPLVRSRDTLQRVLR